MESLTLIMLHEVTSEELIIISSFSIKSCKLQNDLYDLFLNGRLAGTMSGVMDSTGPLKVANLWDVFF